LIVYKASSVQIEAFIVGKAIFLWGSPSAIASGRYVS
jgi:hypothetical protein